MISVCRRQIIEIEEALVEEITSTLAETTSTIGTKGSSELLRLMEQLAALRVIGQQLSLQVKVRDYDFGFDDDYCYDGRLAEVEELANLTEHLLRPALEQKGHKALLDQSAAMLARLDRAINGVNEQKITIDYGALELDEEDLPRALLALVVPEKVVESEESKEETAPPPVPPAARKALHSKPIEEGPTVKAEDELQAHRNLLKGNKNRKTPDKSLKGRKNRKTADKSLKGGSKKKRNSR